MAHDTGADRAGRASPPDAVSAAGDDLTDALVALAHHYGHAVMRAGLIAGLPLVGGRLPIEHVALAAARARLATSQRSVKLLKLAASELPVLVLTLDNRIEILWQLVVDDRTGLQQAIVSLPSSADVRVTVPALELVAGATGDIIDVRPESGLDARTGSDQDRPRSNWFLSAFAESRGIYAQAIAATFAINVLALAMPLFSMNVYDRVLPNAAESTLWALGIGVMIAIGFDFLIRTLRALFVDAASRRADVRLANHIYGRLLGAELPVRPASTGVRANTMREFETLRDFFNSATITAFGDFPFLFLFVGFIFIVAGPLGWIVLAAIPTLLLIGWLTQRALDTLIQTSFQETAQKNAVVVETLIGIVDLKAAGGESWAAQKWERAVAEHVRTGLKLRQTQNLGLHLLQAAQTLFQVFVILAGFYLVSAGDITMGALIAATILTGRALAPLAQVAGLLARFHQARLAYVKLSEIVDAPPERPDGVAFLNKLDVKGAMTFDAVTFQYNQNVAPALSDVSFNIQPGEHVAILGAIGSGKSTALRLMQGHFAPSRGRVLLDDVAIRHIDPALYRSHVALLSQGAELFHGTIRENICLGDTAATDDDVLSAARAAHAFGWINRLPFGFDTEIAERGAGLSGGQRQSLALARTLVRKPKVLLLDEPTSDMDGQTETAIIANLRSLCKERTIILVTHRPALLALCDRLIVLEHGRVVEDGPKQTVLANLNKRNAARVTDAPSEQQDTA